MYDENQLGQFGQADTKLKQLQLKLAESEKIRSQLHQEVKDQRKTIGALQGKVPDAIADQLESKLVSISSSALTSFQQHVALADKSGVPKRKINLQKVKVEQNLIEAFNLIGRTRTKDTLAETGARKTTF